MPKAPSTFIPTWSGVMVSGRNGRRLSGRGRRCFVPRDSEKHSTGSGGITTRVRFDKSGIMDRGRDLGLCTTVQQVLVFWEFSQLATKGSGRGTSDGC